MSSQADQFAAELGPYIGQTVVDKEYARLLTKTGQPAGIYSLRDLYELASETPRLIHGKYSSVGPVTTYSDEVLADNPLLFLKMEDGAGLPTDSSGQPAPTITLITGVNTWVNDATKGMAYDITSTSLTHSVRVPQTAYAYELWFKITGTPVANSTPLSDWGGNVGALGAMFNFSNATDTKFVHAGTTVTGPVIADTTWHHVVYQWTGSALELYLDDVLFASVANTTAPSQGDAARISSFGNLATRFFPGLVKRIAIYDHALSPTRISTHYSKG